MHKNLKDIAIFYDSWVLDHIENISKIIKKIMFSLWNFVVSFLHLNHLSICNIFIVGIHVGIYIFSRRLLIYHLLNIIYLHNIIIC